MMASAPNADELSTRLLARLDALLAGAEPTPRERLGWSSWYANCARRQANRGGAASPRHADGG